MSDRSERFVLPFHLLLLLLLLLHLHLFCRIKLPSYGKVHNSPTGYRCLSWIDTPTEADVHVSRVSLWPAG